jgi:hypothetical protein
MNFSHSRMTVTDDPESDGSVLVTFYPDNVPVQYSISIFDLRKLLEDSAHVIKLDYSKTILTGSDGN